MYYKSRKGSKRGGGYPPLLVGVPYGKTFLNHGGMFMKKRILSCLMALALCLTLLPTSAFAVEDGAEETTPQTKDTEAVATTAPGEMEFVSLTADELDAPYEDLSGDDLLTITGATLAAKSYDGTKTAIVESVNFGGTKNGDSLRKGTDYTATGEFEDANAGTNKKVTVTVTLQGDAANNYKLTPNTFVKNDGKIKKGSWKPMGATGSAKFGTEGTVDLTDLIAEGGKATIEGNPTDADSVLVKDSVSLDGNTLKFKFADDSGKVGKSATVTVKVTGAKNYNDYTITVTLKVTEKMVQEPLKYTGPSTVTYGKTVKLTFEGGSGNGAVTYTSSFNGGQPTTVENGLLTTSTTGTGVFLIKIEKAEDSAHRATYITFTITVTKTPLTIKVRDQKIYVDEAAPDLKDPKENTHYTVTGLVKDDDLKGNAVMKYQQGGKDVTPDTSKSGVYDITLTGLSTATQTGNGLHDNYELEIVPGKLTILARPGGGSTGGTTPPQPSNPGGGSSSSGGGSSSSGGGSSSSGGGSSSSGGGSSSSGGSDKSSTGKTETTTKPDGTTVKTETRADGTKIQTETRKDGSTVKTTTNPNGSSVTETKAADGSTGTVKTDKNGQTTAETALSSKAIETAKRNGKSVKAPVEVKATRDSSTAPTVKIEMPRNSGETKVEIPVTNVKPGAVAVLVHADGTEEIVKNSLPTEDGIQLTVNGGATVKIVDNSKDFVDTRSHWAKDAIDFVSARGLVNGMNDSIYAPNNSTTRAQLWTILARQNDADLNGGNTWFENAQNWAKAKGISDGANPNGTINRAQMVTMLWRAMGQPAAGGSASFTDVPADSYYAQAVSWAVENGITTGVGGGRFDPNATCTRAQIATFLYRYMK